MAHLPSTLLRKQYLHFYMKTIKTMQQIITVNNAMIQMGVRCDRAGKAGNGLYQQQLRLRLDVMEGMKTLLEEYLGYLTDELEKIDRLVQLL